MFYGLSNITNFAQAWRWVDNDPFLFFFFNIQQCLIILMIAMIIKLFLLLTACLLKNEYIHSPFVSALHSGLHDARQCVVEIVGLIHLCWLHWFNLEETLTPKNRERADRNIHPSQKEHVRVVQACNFKFPINNDKITFHHACHLSSYYIYWV